MHHRAAASVVAIGAQRHGQIILVLAVDPGEADRGIVRLSAVATVALLSKLTDKLRPVFRRSRFLHGVIGGDILDVLVGERGHRQLHGGVLAPVAVGLGGAHQIVGIL